MACIDGTLSHHADVQWHDEAAACVVMASGGYPDPYQTGEVITGLENSASIEGINVFHAGTEHNGENIVTAGGRVLCINVFHAGTEHNGENIVTAGGRVLCVTAVAEGLQDAIHRAYQGVSAIQFVDAHFRNDIGYRALERN
jgi:phosphoribosylamine--glycine ligase